jgi:hypothetical protein
MSKSKTVCGHFRFTVRDNWILCKNCPHGIRANSPMGQLLLAKRNGLDPIQQAIFQSLQDSHRDYLKKQA